MKKFLAIFLGVIFTMSFAASAFAIHAEIPSETQAVVAGGGTQITLSGELRTRGWYLKNIGSDKSPSETPSYSFYDERIRLAVDAKVSPNVEGYVQLESGNSGYGSANDLYRWGNFDSKPTTLTVLQAWMMYSGAGLFGFPSGLKIGHMPLALGQQQFFDHTKFGDDAIVFFMLPTKELEIDLLTIKFADQSSAINGNGMDLDGYVGILSYKLDDKNSIGVNYTYLNSPRGLGLPATVTDQRGAVAPRFSHQNLELTANGNVSGLGYKAELDIQFGKVAEDVKAKGYALLVGLNYMIDPLNVRAMFGYGSGQPSDEHDVKQFINYLGADQHYTLVYDYSVATAAGAGLSPYGDGRYTGLANTTVYNLGIDVAPIKDITASVDGYLLRASKENPIFGSDSKKIGWEVDGKVKYSVAKNLTYQVDAGFLKSGDFYGPDKKDATVLRHMITLSF